MNRETMKTWLAPAGLALLFSLMGGSGSYYVMAAQVKQNTASIVVISGALAAQAADKIAELEGRLAVLRHIANNGGLSEGQRLEFNNLEKRLKALK